MAESIQDGDTRHKCCPPIRNKTNQDGLWDELLSNREDPSESVIQTIVSDHSPCTPNLKLLPPTISSSSSSSQQVKDHYVNNKPTGDFFAAWGGISSVGLGLPLLWTEALKRDSNKSNLITDIVRWCSINTAKQVGLEGQKGELSVGYDGDVAVFDDESEFVVQHDTMLFRNKCSPYEGATLKGVVRETWVRGHKVFSRHAGFAKEGPSGRLLLETRRV